MTHIEGSYFNQLITFFNKHIIFYIAVGSAVQHVVFNISCLPAVVMDTCVL